MLAVVFTVEGVLRLIDPPEVDGGLVLGTALVGIVVNLAAAYALSKANRQSLNVEGSFQHIVTDLYAFIGTAVAAGVILFTGWDRADPVATLLVAALMLKAGAGLVRESGRVFLEASPARASTRAPSRRRSSRRRASSACTSSTSGRSRAASRRCPRTSSSTPASDCHASRQELEAMLGGTFGIDHTTLQVDHRDEHGHDEAAGRPDGRVALTPGTPGRSAAPATTTTRPAADDRERAAHRDSAGPHRPARCRRRLPRGLLLRQHPRSRAGRRAAPRRPPGPAPVLAQPGVDDRRRRGRSVRGRPRGQREPCRLGPVVGRRGPRERHRDLAARGGGRPSFFLLAPYVAVQAVHDLLTGQHATGSRLGIALTVSSVVLMPLLGRAKQRLGSRLGSGATAGEGTQNMLCAYLAGAVLIGLVANSLVGAWWLDPLIALAVAGVAVREGRGAWRGEECC